MTDSVLQTYLSRIQHLLKTIHLVAIATTAKTGKPHNTPVFMAFDLNLQAYWASNLKTQHSRNILENNRIMMVIFDSVTGNDGGVYIEAEAQPLIADDADFRQAYDALSELKEHTGGVMASKEHYLRRGSQRLYRAQPKKLWINLHTKDDNGAIIADERIEVPLAAVRKAVSR